jgi:3-methylfumaryl-CoA hydratase
MRESEWASWIGRQSSIDDVLDPQQANRMAATLDREPTFQTGDPLPPAWQWLYFHDVVPASQLGDAGHPRLGVTMPPVPLPRRMWAGGRLDFIEPLRLGERVQQVSTIRSITPKQGKTGPLYFVTVEHAFSTDGRRNLLEQQIIVYREMSATVQPARGAATPTGAEFTTKWSLDNTALFRYSALTFNGHRIHYDADYSRSVEGYPNIVIHGPLIATLLLDLAHRNGRPIARFTYRARSPLFLPSPFTVNGAATSGGTRLWAANDSGGLAMEAEVHAEPEN